MILNRFFLNLRGSVDPTHWTSTSISELHCSSPNDLGVTVLFHHESGGFTGEESDIEGGYGIADEQEPDIVELPRV